MKKTSKKKGMAISDDNVHVRVKVSKDLYEQMKEAAARDRRSFSSWAAIALEEKLIRELKTPRP